MRLNQAGEEAKRCWEKIPEHFPNVMPDTFTIMPNHIHGILIIESEGMETNPLLNVGAKNLSPPKGTSKTIGSVIRGFKIGVTKWMRKNTHDKDVWQRNYYEHIIRNDKELNEIREYIITNPRRWDMDRENPDVVKQIEM
jgi:REP element-mobilizing transposase RayT